MRRTLVAVLRENGYAATGLPSASTALERLGQLRPRLVLLDMELPGMSGSEFLVRLRAMPSWAELPVLIVSGYGETCPPSPERPGLAVLAKPVDSARLLECVERMIGPAPAVESGC